MNLNGNSISSSISYARKNGGLLACRSGALLAILLIAIQTVSLANGIYREGTGPRGMALVGAEGAWAEDALGPMALNPAGLGMLVSPVLDFSLSGSLAQGRFDNPSNNGAKLDKLGAWPDAAFALPIKSTPLTLGFSVIPEAAKNASWAYIDTPGGLGGVS